MIITNGNAKIEILADGTRTITYKDELILDYPLNIDIRVSSSCSFADNVCKEFCHESALVKGKECNYTHLKERIRYLPKGIELAIGCNEFTTDLYEFIFWCYKRDFICNLTINQGHLLRDSVLLRKAMFNDYIKGLGISYRASLKWNIPSYILKYPHTVLHTIIGIDDFQKVLSLHELGVKKILCLGEKDFGFNSNKVDLNSRKHKEWFWWIKTLINTFEVVSFDNLALEQLQLKRFFTEEQWETFNQGEHSFYIDAVNKVYKPSSRSNLSMSWNGVSLKNYFKYHKNEKIG